MLVPLRPVTIAPCAAVDKAPIIDKPEGPLTYVPAQQASGAPLSPSTPRLTSTSSLPLTLLASPELQLGRASAQAAPSYSPIAQLFLEALQAAPAAVMVSISRSLEHMIYDSAVTSPLRKELYLSVLEQLCTTAALTRALHMLTPLPSHLQDVEEEEVAAYGGSTATPLQDLSMAIALAARHSMHGSDKSPSDKELKQTEADSTVLDSSGVATDLWQDLLARTSPAGKVLVQYNQQLVTAGRLDQSEQLGADLDLLWNSILKVSSPEENSDSCSSLQSDMEKESQPLLKDAVAAVTSVVRTVSMHSEASTLHRCVAALFMPLSMPHVHWFPGLHVTRRRVVQASVRCRSMHTYRSTP